MNNPIFTVDTRGAAPLHQRRIVLVGKQPFVLWRDDELKKFLDKGKPGYVHGDSVTVLGWIYKVDTGYE